MGTTPNEPIWLPMSGPAAPSELAEDPSEQDRRPRWLRRVLPISYATAEPLTGTQMAKLHLIAYH